LFAVFNILLLISAQRLFRPYLISLESLGKFVPEAIFFCFCLPRWQLFLGQDSILLLMLAVLAFIALDKGEILNREFCSRSVFQISIHSADCPVISAVAKMAICVWRRARWIWSGVPVRMGRGNGWMKAFSGPWSI